MRKLLFLLILTTAFASCNSTKTDVTINDQYLVFGKYFGHCLNECATLFKIDGTQLFADDLARFTDWDSLRFKSTALPAERYESASVLLDAFPQELLNVTEETIGCPDCADQGGFALEIRKDGKLQHWRIDTRREALPAYLKAYIAQMDAVIERLQ